MVFIHCRDHDFQAASCIQPECSSDVFRMQGHREVHFTAETDVLFMLIDAGSSAVVCAPTSSGKTFISSYVIQKVLKPPHAPASSAGSRTKTSKAPSGSSSSNGRGSVSDGVVVIVLPTKALVNQLAAQVSQGITQI